MPDGQTYTIELPQPGNETELNQRLAAVVKFANKLGLQGLRATRLDFARITTSIVPVIALTAHCEPREGPN